MLCVSVSGWCGSLNRHSCTWKKNSQHSQDDDRFSHVGYQESTCLSWHPSLLSVSHVVLYFNSTFILWVVYCSYTRPRDCLLSARLTRTVIVTVHEQQVTKKEKTKTKNNEMKKTPKVFNLVKVRYPVILYLISRTNTLNSFQVFSNHLYGLIFPAIFWDFLSEEVGHILQEIRRQMSFRLYWKLKLFVDSAFRLYQLRIFHRLGEVMSPIEISAVNLNKSFVI